MDRERFESALDKVIAAHERKVCAEVDAGACRTPRDFDRMHRARDAFAEAREVFIEEVFAPPPPPPAPPQPVPVIIAWEEEVRGRTRGRPLVWRRGIEIRIPWRGVLYTFTADASFLAVDGGVDEIEGPDFLPLSGGHTIRFRGIDYESRDDGPAELAALALDACRTVALRLHQAGLSNAAIRRPWPAEGPTFSTLVAGEARVTTAA